MIQIKTAFLSMIFLVSGHALAQAGTDCGQALEHFAQKCERAVQDARIYEGEGVGAEHGLEKSMKTVKGLLKKAQQDCQKNHLEACVQFCNEALKSAGQNSKVVQQIRQNMQSCRARITGAISSAEQSVQGLK
jgi:hypothetical protein